MNSTENNILAHYPDEFGPAKTIHLYDPHSGMKGIVVIDNVACGPAIGGVRMAAEIGTDEIIRLARTMTLKNAAAGLAHGGGKAGIMADPHCADKQSLLRAFARLIRELVDYIPGPDMGTNERCMGFIHDEIGRCVGRPRVFGGIPLDELGATGYGLAQVAKLALPFAGIDMQNGTMAIQGFGSVGQHAARFLTRLGLRLVAVSDSTGAIYHQAGLDPDELIRGKQLSGSVLSYAAADKLDREALLTLPCDILIPAARPDVITADNAQQIRAKIIIEGANIPLTEEAERMLHERGILCIPDFIANAGGVICAAVEYSGGSERAAMAAVRAKLHYNTGRLLELLAKERCPPRDAALRLADARIREAMDMRR